MMWGHGKKMAIYKAGREGMDPSLPALRREPPHWHGHLRHPASRTVRQYTAVWALQSAVPCGGSPSKPEDCCSPRTGFSTTRGSISRCHLFPECWPTWSKQKRIKEHLLIHTFGRKEIVMIATVYKVGTCCVCQWQDNVHYSNIYTPYTSCFANIPYLILSATNWGG